MRTKKQEYAREETVPTAGEILGDGKAVELIRDATANAGLQLLTWNGRAATAVDRFAANDTTYVPINVEPTIGRALRLPTGAESYGSTRRLFDEVSKLVSRIISSPDIVTQVAFFIFATWLADRLPVAPFLWITAPPTVSTGPLLQLLPLLCRRALLLSEPTASALRSLPMQLTPTVLTEVSTIAPPFLKFLRASNNRGSLVIERGKLVNLYCAKVVISNQPLRDRATVGFPLEIALPPSRGYIPRLDTQEAEKIALEFQAKLLMYRLTNYANVTAPSFDLGEYSAPTQEVALSLAACIVGDDALQSGLIPLLQARDREIQADRACLLEAIVLEALLASCHDSKSSEVSVAELTKSVNTILCGRGESQQISPEIIGWKLRGLGLHTEPTAGGRKCLKLPKETGAAIHTMAAAYGVRALQQRLGVGECSVCAALQNEKKTA